MENSAENMIIIRWAKMNRQEDGKRNCEGKKLTSLVIKIVWEKFLFNVFFFAYLKENQWYKKYETEKIVTVGWRRGEHTSRTDKNVICPFRYYCFAQGNRKQLKWRKNGNFFSHENTQGRAKYDNDDCMTLSV